MAEHLSNKSDAAFPPPSADAAPRKRPSYLVIFVVLAALTVLEVAVTYTPLPRLPVLLPLALLKAALVVLFYMHLVSDNRIFAALFMMGLLMGVILVVSLALLFGPPLFGLRQ